MGRGLLQGLQKCVRGRTGDLVGFIDDVDLRGQHGRGVADPVAKIADVVDTTIAGGVDLDDIGGRVPVDGNTVRADVAGSRLRVVVETIHRLSNDTSGGGFARTSGTAKKIGVG